MADYPKADILPLYASFMAEVKARLSSLDDQLVALKNVKDNIHATFMAEFGYLQLRRVTELAALGVALVHHPIPDFRSNKLIKEWNADKLMRQIARLNPKAFPQRAPSFPAGTDAERGHYIMLPKDFSPQPREDICRIYTECGDKLHTGHLRALLEQRNKAYSPDFLREAMHTMFKMLNEHVIVLPDESLIHAKLKLEAPGPVQCQWMGSSPPSGQIATGL